MAQRKRRGFTIVELVIVIAVIAILAGVLIPTFVSIINKANVASDTSLVKNINEALVAEEVTEGKPATMYEALQRAEANGFTIEKLTPRSTGDIVWNSTSNRFALVDKDGNVVYSANEEDVPHNATVWKIAQKPTDIDGTYSNYLAYDVTDETITVTTGIDVGENQGLNVVYNGTISYAVTIRANAGNLTIDSDSANVNFYGLASDVTVTKCAPASFHVYGEIIGKVSVRQGHVVVENGAKIAQPIVVEHTTGAVKVSAEEVVSIVVDSTATANVEIASEKPIYVDDKTNGNNVQKPATAVAPIELSSENDVKLHSIVDSDGDYALKTGSYKLTGSVTIAHQVYIEAGNTVILDLNGNTFESTYYAYGLYNEGSLTINDTVGAGLIFNSAKTTKYNANGYFGHDAIRNAGLLTINGGRFGDSDADETNANDANYGTAVRNQANGICVINGGSFTCLDNYGRFDNYGKDIFSYAIRNYGTMTINYAHVYGKMNGGIAADGGQITINDGQYSLNGTNTFYIVANDSGTTTINGGTFTRFDNDRLFGGYNGMPSWNALESLKANGFVVTGGTFTVNGEQIKIK